MYRAHGGNKPAIANNLETDGTLPVPSCALACICWPTPTTCSPPRPTRHGAQTLARAAAAGGGSDHGAGSATKRGAAARGGEQHGVRGFLRAVTRAEPRVRIWCERRLQPQRGAYVVRVRKQLPRVRTLRARLRGGGRRRLHEPVRACELRWHTKCYSRHTV